MTEVTEDPSTEHPSEAAQPDEEPAPTRERGKTVHGEAANAGHRVLAPDDAEVGTYLEVALDAPPAVRPAIDRPVEPDTVIVLDFGSQFAQLIARRVRELNVYSELLPHDTPWAEIERRAPKALILSGGPNSVYDVDAPRPDSAIWTSRIPVLGICYGAHLMAQELGGDVLPATRREYGPATVTVTDDDGLFTGLDREQPVWMSHGDSITRLPEGFRATAQTDSTPYAGLADKARGLYGIQFHPEVASHAARPRGHPQLRAWHRRGGAQLDPGQLHRPDRRRDPDPRRRPRQGDGLGRAGHLRPVRAGSTRRSRPPSSIAPSATG